MKAKPILSNIDPIRIQTADKAFMDNAKNIYYSRIDGKQLKWCYTSFPAQALAQEADMGIEEYKKFVFDSLRLNEPDPRSAWKKISQNQVELCEWLYGKSEGEILVDGELCYKNGEFVKFL